MEKKISRSQRLNSYFNLFLRLALFALLVILLHAIYKGLKQDGYIIQAIQTPKSFTDSGYSGYVIANKLQDKVAYLKASANSSRSDSLKISANTSGDLKMDVMGIGVSSTSLTYHLKDLLNIESKTIKGDLTDLDNELTMTTRVYGFPVKVIKESYSETSSSDAFEKLITKVAEHILSCIDPYYHTINLYKSGKYDEAHEMITDMIANRPGEAKWAYLAWGNMMVAQNKREEGREYYQEAISLDDNFYLANKNLAWQYYNDENFEKAIKHFEKSLEDVKDDFQPINGIALCYKSLGNTDKAEEYFKMNVDLNPDLVWSYMAYADFYTGTKKDTAAAIDIYKTAKVSATKNDDYYLTLAGYYYFQSKEDSAFMFLNKSLDFNPDNASALQQIVGYHLSPEVDNSEAAVPYIKRLIKIMKRNSYDNDSRIQAYNMLAISEWKSGALDSAYVHANKAISIDPSQAIPYTTLAEIYYAQGNVKMVYKIMQKSVDLGLHFPEDWFEDEPYDSLKNDARFMRIIGPAIEKAKAKLKD